MNLKETLASNTEHARTYTSCDVEEKAKEYYEILKKRAERASKEGYYGTCIKLRPTDEGQTPRERNMAVAVFDKLEKMFCEEGCSLTKESWMDFMDNFKVTLRWN